MSTFRQLKCDGCGKELESGDVVLGLEIFRSTAEEARGGVWSGREVARGEVDVCGDCVGSPLLTIGVLAERVLRPVPVRRARKMRAGGEVSVDCDGEDES